MSSKDDAATAPPGRQADAARPQVEARLVTTAELFGGVNEVTIDHEGERYRLRRTSKGKLILTK